VRRGSLSLPLALLEGFQEPVLIWALLDE